MIAKRDQAGAVGQVEARFLFTSGVAQQHNLHLADHLRKLPGGNRLYGIVLDGAGHLWNSLSVSGARDQK